MLISLSNVKEITLQGEQYPLAFNMMAALKFQEETGMNVFDVINKISTELIVPGAIPFFWHALVQGHKIKGIEVPFKRAVLESMDFEYFLAFSNEMTAALNKMHDNTKKQIAEQGKRKSAELKKKA